MKKIVITDDILCELIKKYNDGISANKLSKEYGIDEGTIISRLQSIGVYKNKNYRYTKEDIDFLKDNYADAEWDVILDRFKDTTKQSVITKASKLGLKRKIDSEWSEDDLKILHDNFYLASISDIRKMIGNRHSESAIVSKANKYFRFFIKRWSNEETDILIKYYENKSIDEIMAMLPDRSRDSIIKRAMYLGLKSFNNYAYSEEEDSVIINNWEVMNDGEIAKIIGRNERSVQDRRLYLGIRRSSEHKDDFSGYNDLKSFLRSQLYNWQYNTINECGGKCILTNSDKYDIHHKYGFSSIFRDTFDNNKDKIELKEYCEYTYNELLEIRRLFLLEHGKHGNGVCVRKDLHKMFHSLYGHKYNTEDQWESFKNNYFSGLITNAV